MGTAPVAGSARASWVRRARTGSFDCAARADPAGCGGYEFAPHQLHNCSAVFSPPAPTGGLAPSRSLAAVRIDAEEPAPPSRGGVDTAGAGEGTVSSGDRR